VVLSVRWRINFQERAVSSVVTVRFSDFILLRVYTLVLVGHIAENCTSEQRLCYNCRQPGHESASCPQPRTVSTKQCYSCGGVGHIQAECPSLRLQGGNQKCYVSFHAYEPYRALINNLSVELWPFWARCSPMPE
jgi:hypothetical protein